MKTYRFSITIIEDEKDKCTRIFNKVSSTKLQFISDYIESLGVYNKAQQAADAEQVEEVQQTLL